MNEEKISIIVPVYNVAPYLAACVDSLLSQTHRDVEIILVDDGSSDGSAALCDALCQRDGRVAVIHQPNSGVSAARNAGLDKATGCWVAFVDGDDLVSHDMYEKLLAASADGQDLVLCGFFRFFTSGKILKYRETSLKKLEKDPGDIRDFLYSRPYRTEGNVLTTPDIHGGVWRGLFKNRIIRENAIRFQTDLRFAEDRVFMLQYLLHAKRVAVMDDCLYQYRAQTKPWRYLGLIENHLRLLAYQKDILQQSSRYSTQEKTKLINYLRCTTYFMIINEELMFKPDAPKVIPELEKRYGLRKLLTFGSFAEKYRVNPDVKRIVLFVLIKLHAWGLVQRFYPNKKY